MSISRASLIVLACAVLLWAIVTQTNHYLAPWNVSLFLGGLFVSFPALRLAFREGWWLTFFSGLMFDAGAPVPFGLHGFLFLLCHTIIYTLRYRFPREEILIGAVVAILSNLGIFFAMTLTLVHRSPISRGLGLRLVGDLLVSQVAIVLIAPWYIALQERALQIGGATLRRATHRGLL